MNRSYIILCCVALVALGLAYLVTLPTETAEATKLMENIFRAVNIAMVNELKLIFE